MGTSTMNKDKLYGSKGNTGSKGNNGSKGYNGRKNGRWKQRELIFLITYAFVFYVIIIRRSLQLSNGISLISDCILLKFISELFFLVLLIFVPSP